MHVFCFNSTCLTKHFRSDNYHTFMSELSPHVEKPNTLVDLTNTLCKHYFVLKTNANL